MDCFVASAPLRKRFAFVAVNDEMRHDAAFSRRDAPEFCFKIPALCNQRAQGMPGARCARSRACSVVNTRVSHHGHTGNTRHSPRNGFNGFLHALPGDRACLPPSLADCSANLTPASGRQDHTTSPSASAPFVCVFRPKTQLRRCCRVHRIPCPTFVTIAKRPSVGRDEIGYSFDLGPV
jgi:hypothetical protein